MHYVEAEWVGSPGLANLMRYSACSGLYCCLLCTFCLHQKPLGLLRSQVVHVSNIAQLHQIFHLFESTTCLAKWSNIVDWFLEKYFNLRLRYFSFQWMFIHICAGDGGWKKNFCRPDDGYFRCENNNCILRRGVHNYMFDCGNGDGSDETGGNLIQRLYLHI